jgi:hypothetical protein
VTRRGHAKTTGRLVKGARRHVKEHIARSYTAVNVELRVCVGTLTSSRPTEFAADSLARPADFPRPTSLNEPIADGRRSHLTLEGL